MVKRTYPRVRSDAGAVSLPIAKGQAFEMFLSDPRRIVSSLRGGFWRSVAAAEEIATFKPGIILLQLYGSVFRVRISRDYKCTVQREHAKEAIMPK